VRESITLYGLLAPVGIKGYYDDAHSGWSDWGRRFGLKGLAQDRKEHQIAKSEIGQEAADCVCAGLDILGLVCVGVFASLCAVTESVVLEA
jgi:hypothetical protein